MPSTTTVIEMIIIVIGITNHDAHFMMSGILSLPIAIHIIDQNQKLI